MKHTYYLSGVPAVNVGDLQGTSALGLTLFSMVLKCKLLSPSPSLQQHKPEQNFAVIASFDGMEVDCTDYSRKYTSTSPGSVDRLLTYTSFGTQFAVLLQ
jgi:hypothetical protein